MYAYGEIVAIIDADHQFAADAVRRVVRWSWTAALLATIGSIWLHAFLTVVWSWSGWINSNARHSYTSA